MANKDIFHKKIATALKIFPPTNEENDDSPAEVRKHYLKLDVPALETVGFPPKCSVEEDSSPTQPLQAVFHKHTSQ